MIRKTRNKQIIMTTKKEQQNNNKTTTTTTTTTQKNNKNMQQQPHKTMITLTSNYCCYYKNRCRRHQRCRKDCCCCRIYWQYYATIVLDYILSCCCCCCCCFYYCYIVSSYYSSRRYTIRMFLSNVIQCITILMIISTTKNNNILVECTTLNIPISNLSNSTIIVTSLLDQIRRKDIVKSSSLKHTVTQKQQQKQQRSLQQEQNHLQRMKIQQHQQQSTLPQLPNEDSLSTTTDKSDNNDNNNHHNNLIAIIHIGPMKTGSSAIQKGYMYTKNALLHYDNYSDISWSFTGTNIQTWNYIGCYRTDINSTSSSNNNDDTTSNHNTIRRRENSRQLQQSTLTYGSDIVKNDNFHNDEDDYDYEDDYYFNRNVDSDDFDYDYQFVQQYTSQTRADSDHSSKSSNSTVPLTLRQHLQNQQQQQQQQQQAHRKLVELKCNKESIKLMTLLSTQQKKHLIISAEYLTYPYLNVQSFSDHIKKYWSKQQKIIAYYRRYYEWLLSLHNQISKYKLPPNRKTFLFIVQKEIKRKFKWHRDYIISAIQRFQQYFNNTNTSSSSIHIYNLHDTIQIPNGDVRYHFFCVALINATHACSEFIKQRSMYETTFNDTSIGSSKLHSSSSAALRNFENPSVPLVYSELVYYAIELGFISLNGQSIFDRVYNSNLIKFTQKFHKERIRQNSLTTENTIGGNNNLFIDNDDMKDYRICPNATEYDWLLQQSLKVEETLFPMYYKQYGKIEISIDYNYIKTHYIFCHYNTKEFLQNNIQWKQFYLSILE